MQRDGHVGLTLVLASTILAPFGVGADSLALIPITSVLSPFPDIDQRWEIRHRARTHNILAAVLLGGLYSILLLYFSNLHLALIGFLAGFGGVVSHLAGDMMAGLKSDGSPWKIKPLWPFSQIEMGVGWFKSGDKRMNESFLMLGFLALFLYVASGTDL
jgi:membrane-bound metal-dependent hydrolase YbcI (DUF457 family)